MRRALAALVAVIAVVAAAGCGLPDDDRPRLIAAADAPIDLAPTTVPPDTTPDPAAEDVNVFFVDDEGRLRSVSRAVESVSAEEAIRALLAESDPPGLLRNSIPPATELLTASLEGDVLIVDLTPAGEGGIQSVQGQTQIEAFAQIVQTATALSGIRSVRFRVDGVDINAITGNGEATPAPVSRADYASLQPTAG